MAATRQAAIASTQRPEVTTHEKIASLAYALWLERGCPEGSPETDWLAAEQESLTKAGVRERAT